MSSRVPGTKAGAQGVLASFPLPYNIILEACFFSSLFPTTGVDEGREELVAGPAAPEGPGEQQKEGDQFPGVVCSVGFEKLHILISYRSVT